MLGKPARIVRSCSEWPAALVFVRVFLHTFKDGDVGGKLEALTKHESNRQQKQKGHNHAKYSARNAAHVRVINESLNRQMRVRVKCVCGKHKKGQKPESETQQGHDCVKEQLITAGLRNVPLPLEGSVFVDLDRQISLTNQHNLLGAPGAHHSSHIPGSRIGEYYNYSTKSTKVNNTPI